MVHHVKFVMHFKDFMAFCNIGGLDGWVPLQNIGARAGGPQDWCTPDKVCSNGAQTRQTGFTILCYSDFLRRNLKQNDMLKILAACHPGAPFQPGALRTCVPCLMVNPALLVTNVSWWARPWCGRIGGDEISVVPQHSAQTEGDG